MLLILAVFSVFQCLAALATSEILDRYTSSTNKVVISAVGLITFLISFVCLGLGPSGVVDIG